MTGRARSRMTMRCAIRRNTAATDDWGQPGAPGWTAHLASVPCNAWAATVTEIVDATSTGQRASQVAVVSQVHLLLPEATDVTEKDQIVSVTDRQGAELFAGPMNIQSVDRTPREHLHLTALAAR